MEEQTRSSQGMPHADSRSSVRRPDLRELDVNRDSVSNGGRERHRSDELDQRMRWLSDEDGWLWPRDGGVGRLKFKFSTGDDDDPYKLVLSQIPELMMRAASLGGDGHGSPVITYLRNATDLKVEAHVGEEVTLGRALQNDPTPVPKLESLEVQCYVGQTIARTVLDAMRARKFTALKTLVWVEHNLADQEGYIQALADVIATGPFPSLSKVDFNFDHYNPTVGLEALATSLKSLRALQYLRVRGKAMGKGHSALATVILNGHLQGLEVLDLTRAGIEDSDCEAYGAAFRSGCLPRLQELHFGSNEIQDEGAAALAKVLAAGHLAKVVHLDLNTNWIGDEGVKALAESFRVAVGGPTSMKHVNLQSNEFTTKGLESLSAVLSSGQLNGLETLRLRYNKSSTEKGARILVDAFSSNIFLTVNVDIEWEKYPDLDMLKEQVLKRNRRHAKIMAELRGRQVPATFARVYVCGNQQVGKTTLRKSIARGRFEGLIKWERKPARAEKPTRGIDVARVVVRGSNPGEEPVTMMVWDMAGQEEYHMLHNSFFPDLALAEGKATVFIVVCSSKNDAKAGLELDYWLRFIASSCGTDMHNPRHVIVVFNRLNGDTEILNRAHEWRAFLQQQRIKFEGSLEIQVDPYVADVRRRADVQDLKESLVQEIRITLEGQKVPEICQFIQSNLHVWSEEKKHFPVLGWPDFLKKVQSESPQWPEETVEAAAKYLNEAGIVIYIDKEFPAEWSITSKRMLVLDPNWFCSEIVGNMLLPDHMVRPNERPFSLEVERATGSISISSFKEFFQLGGDLDDSEFDDLLGILLWLGICYKGRKENVYVPTLIQEDTSQEDSWFQENSLDPGEGRWVMGYSIEHQPSQITLAPIAVWRRYQVELAQSPEYNGHPDNDFLVSKGFITFKVDYMTVLIKVNEHQEMPTFDGIDIFVKPLLVDQLDAPTRKLRQVELASNLGWILRHEVWNEVCPGVRNVKRVVWPWPASRGSRPMSEELKKRNVELKEVKRWVGEHGLGRSMHWTVGSETITEDQLLSRKDKEQVLQSVQENVSFLKTGMREAVELGIFPHEILHEDEPPETPKGIPAMPSTPTSPVDPASPVDSQTQKVLVAVRELRTLMSERHRQVMSELGHLNDLGQANLKLTDEVRFLMRSRNDMLRRVHDMGETIFKDRESPCPRYIYLGKQDSGTWVTLKEALSPALKIRVHFACEARYNDYRQHPAANQPGVDVSELKDWAKKIAPWLKVSAAVLSMSARVAANAVAPGLGLIIPNFEAWEQVSSLTEGIALAVGFSQEELDKHMEGMQVDTNASQENPQELHRYSKKVMTDFLKKMSPQEFEEKVGLSKVRLAPDPESRSSPSVAWICRDCYEKFRRSGMVHDLD